MDDENLPVQCHPPNELKKKKKVSGSSLDSIRS
jgi:hypothetical protein